MRPAPSSNPSFPLRGAAPFLSLCSGERWPAFHSLHLAQFYLYAEAEDNQDRLPAGPEQWVRRPVSRLMADPNGKASVAYWFRFGLKGSPGLRSLWDISGVKT